MDIKNFSKVLGLVFTAACGGSTGAGEPELETPRSALPPELAGEWFTGTLSSIQYYDQTTGVWQDPSGEGFYFVLGADGSYETGAVIDSTVGNCRMRLLGKEIGTVTLDGADLTVYRHWVKTHVANSCGNDGERTQGQATRAVSWGIETDDSGLDWLVMTGDDGSVERYRRWTN